MSDVYESFEHEGVRVEIHYDHDAGEHCNPRELDNITTLVCWHPDYILGDYQLRNPEGRGAVGQIFETDRGRTDFSSMEAFQRYLTLMLKARCVSPLYLYDHSGISMSVGSPNPFNFDAQGWDTSLVGFAYCTEERVTELCGPEEQYHTDAFLTDAIKADVAEYNLYLTGQVYGYVVAPGTEDQDSCWGFLGDETVVEEAKAAAALVAVDVAERERIRRIYSFHPDTLLVAS